MPTFDFQCKHCDHVFEFTRPFASKVKPSCPSCSSKKVEKLIAPPAVHFKGAGWYKTDSKKSSASAKETKTEDNKAEQKKPATAPETSKAAEKPKETPKKDEKKV